MQTLLLESDWNTTLAKQLNTETSNKTVTVDAKKFVAGINSANYYVELLKKAVNASENPTATVKDGVVTISGTADFSAATDKLAEKLDTLDGYEGFTLDTSILTGVAYTATIKTDFANSKSVDADLSFTANGKTYGVSTATEYANDVYTNLAGQVTAAVDQKVKELAAKYGQVPGHIRVADLDENYVIDERDYKVLGSPSPDWTAGMTNTFTYKNWDLSFYMYARIGGTYNDDFTYMFTAWDNEHWNKLNVKYWTPENHSNEYQQIGAQSYHTQVLGKISGSFLKIQNITLGYTLPENWMKKMKMKNARAYINVQNPFTFTDYLGPDPETIGEDVYKSLSLYPMTFTFGVNLTF